MSSQPHSPHAFPGAGLPLLRAVCLSGRDAVLPYARLLEELAGSLGQDGSMHWMGYFLYGESARLRRPLLVLLVLGDRESKAAAPLTASQVFGAGLFSEYMVCGLRTGAVSTEDTSGFRTVLAPESLRAAVAMRCAQTMLRCGAHLVLTSYAGQPPTGPKTEAGLRWAFRSRIVESHLELKPALAATLAGFNRTVRFRLGYYRRRLLQSTPCCFVADAMAELTPNELLVLNARSLNPVTDEEALLRWNACSLPGGYTLGLRTADGQWLSIIGGWRQGTTTVLHWQLNVAGWEKYSLSTVLRSYFLEHETARHTQRIVFYGGTPHSLRHYFAPVAVTDLLVRRQTLWARILLLLAHLFASTPAHTHKPNFLVETLVDEHLQWRK